ncbi:MAG: hypothetical protein FJ091_21930 [Deltaproteobacteria bacterium]|nr:hypothetical protein [Deltaproteobacteria bacterium]
MTGNSLARALVVALAVLGSACASLKDPMHQEDAFNNNVRQFTQYVRRGNFQGAAVFLAEEQQEELLALAPQLSDVRFTDYEILRKDLNETRDAGTVDVVYTGYRLSSPISRTMRLHQKWTRTDGKWTVSIELEPMREALGLAAK